MSLQLTVSSLASSLAMTLLCLSTVVLENAGSVELFSL